VRRKRAPSCLVVRRRPERARRSDPRVAVAAGVLGAQPGAEGDQLRELGDGVDAAGVRDAHEPVRVEVVAEQQCKLVVRRVEETGPPVMAEVTLVDRLDAECEAFVAKGREDRLALRVRPRDVRPQRRLAAGLVDDQIPELSC
jgi:hypothetical protein